MPILVAEVLQPSSYIAARQVLRAVQHAPQSVGLGELCDDRRHTGEYEAGHGKHEREKDAEGSAHGGRLQWRDGAGWMIIVAGIGLWKPTTYTASQAPPSIMMGMCLALMSMLERFKRPSGANKACFVDELAKTSTQAKALLRTVHADYFI